jgi:hypothetical protein
VKDRKKEVTTMIEAKRYTNSLLKTKAYIEWLGNRIELCKYLGMDTTNLEEEREQHLEAYYNTIERNRRKVNR